MNNPSGVVIDAIYKLKRDDDDNPFSKPSIYVKALDVKRGWVKYGILKEDGKMGYFGDESCKEETFLKVYELQDTLIKCVQENQ